MFKKDLKKDLRRQMINSKWLKVNKHNLCPICGKPDWCLISEDGKAVICPRIKSDTVIGSKGSGWLHKLDISYPIQTPRPEHESNQIHTAAPDILDITYRALLKKLTLSDGHRNSLRKRGLTDADIDSLGYKTLLAGDRHEVVNWLQPLKLASVPGFYFKSSQWLLAGPGGVAIPVRDISGRIRGIQIRCDTPDGGRYKWLSSRGFNQGCSPGAPVHVAGTTFVGGRIWVTEGALKADIAALKLGCIVLGIAGVSSWGGVMPIMQELKPERVIISFDADKNTNSTVRLHLDELTKSLLRYGIRTFEADWDPHYKGIDDLILKGET
jgi:hypothetical protein